MNACGDSRLRGLRSRKPIGFRQWVVHPEELAQITAPTLVICGTKDMIREDHTRKIAENIPNARLAIIEGDHFVANKRSEEFISN